MGFFLYKINTVVANNSIVNHTTICVWLWRGQRINSILFFGV